MGTHRLLRKCGDGFLIIQRGVMQNHIPLPEVLPYRRKISLGNFVSGRIGTYNRTVAYGIIILCNVSNIDFIVLAFIFLDFRFFYSHYRFWRIRKCAWLSFYNFLLGSAGNN